MSTDVLALGEHLVTELGIEERGDTLSRWMAHHVAELIEQAGSEPPGRKRAQAQKQAAETILKLWEQREHLPHRAYPLAPYKDLLRILDVLQPNNNPYRFSSLSPIDQNAALLFDRLSRLIILLLLIHWQDVRQPEKISAAGVNAMNDEEKQIYARLNDWLAVLQVPHKDSRKRKRDKKVTRTPRSEKAEAKARRESIVQFIDDCTRTLAELRSEITKPTVNIRRIQQ